MSSGSQSVTVNPNEWKNGRMPATASFLVSGKSCRIDSTLAMTLRWESITPLGLPVLPLENMMVASSPFSGARFAAGMNRARSRAWIFRAGLKFGSRSSRKTMPSRSASLALARKAREVKMVRISHCPIAEDNDSSPAVKLRFTGILPASKMATLATAPPTVAGSMRPIILSVGRAALSQSASRRLPVRRRP